MSTKITLTRALILSLNGALKQSAKGHLQNASLTIEGQYYCIHTAQTGTVVLEIGLVPKHTLIVRRPHRRELSVIKLVGYFGTVTFHNVLWNGLYDIHRILFAMDLRSGG